MRNVITMDISQIHLVTNNLANNAAKTKRSLRGKLTKESNKLVRELGEEAPSSKRTARFPDPRYKMKLKDSFYITKQGDTRLIGTYEPQKLALVTLGTNGHIIEPLFKKALWWPGLERPVAEVWHDGTDPNDFVERVFRSHDYDAQGFADAMAQTIVTTHGPSMLEEMDFEGSNGNWKKYLKP